jgi:acetate kinase
MDDYALVLNAGSSSLKFSIYQRAGQKFWRLAARGQIEGIGTSARMSAKDVEGRLFFERELGTSIRDGRGAVDTLRSWLQGTYSNARLLGIGHRIVHGGVKYVRPVVVTREIVADLHNLTSLAPLHQPFNLAAIEAIFERQPDIPQVACFDTSFHVGRPQVAQILPLPECIRSQGLQRYGFHGLSYEYIASVLPDVAPPIADGRVIVAHLGSGASLCALERRRSIDSTMGFTALDGLCMGTRPGSLDPGVVLYLFQILGLSTTQVESLLYKESGLLGLSGLTNDMRVLLNSNEPNARLAIDYFVYRAAKEIAGLATVLGGIDGLVFTAGIGENSPDIRRRICEACAWMGLKLDEEANLHGGPRISAPVSKISAWVIPTNEELMIARHTGLLLGLIREPALSA